MSFGRRQLSRAAAAALLLLGGLTVSAPPAVAAKVGPDLVIDASGTTVPLGVDRKIIYLKISNVGDETPPGLDVVINLDAGSESPVEMMWYGGIGECDGDFYNLHCLLWPDELPEPGETLDIPFLVLLTSAADEPYETSFIARANVMSGGQDANPADNTKTIPLKLVDQLSADLMVAAPDVKQAVQISADGTPEPAGALNPGETGAVWHTVINQGRTTVNGVRVTLDLPEGVTFTGQPDQCVVADGGGSAVCTYEDLTLVPAVEDTDPNDTVYSAVELYNLVTTSETATAPASLQGGIVKVEGLTEESTDNRITAAQTELPENAVAVQVSDVDDSDNQDRFAVVLAAKSDGGGDGGGGGDAGLPVTGPQAGLIGGLGVAVLVAGGVLLLAARRRRMILVAPEDERPAV